MSSYPGIYRAICVSVNGNNIDAYVPQVFGDVKLTITNRTGALPHAKAHGWVIFESSQASLPVWVSGTTGGIAPSVIFGTALVGGDIGKTVQGYNFDLSSIAALTTATYGRDLLTLANAGAGRTTLGLGSAATFDATSFEAAGSATSGQNFAIQRANHTGTQAPSTITGTAIVGTDIGTTVQGYDSDLASIAALTTTSIGRGLLTQVDTPAIRSYIGLVLGTNVQAYHANLAALSGLALVADSLPYANGTGTMVLATLTAAGRALIDDANATAQRTTLGLGTAATKNTPATGNAAPAEVVLGADTRLVSTYATTQFAVAKGVMASTAVPDAPGTTHALATVPQPGGPVNIIATFHGTNIAVFGRSITNLRVEISINGGATWYLGSTVEGGSAGPTDTASTSAGHVITTVAAPTGTVQARAYVSKGNAEAVNLYGHLILQVIPN